MVGQKRCGKRRYHEAIYEHGEGDAVVIDSLAK